MWTPNMNYAVIINVTPDLKGIALLLWQQREMKRGGGRKKERESLIMCMKYGFKKMRIKLISKSCVGICQLYKCKL